MMNKKYTALAGVTLLAALGLTACGGSDATDQAPPADAPAPSSAAPAPAKTKAPAGHSVTYKVDSDGESGSVTLTTFDGGKLAQSQDTAATMPWEKTVALKKQGAFDFSSLSVMAQADGSATTISCEIIVDGKSVAKQTSSGPYSVVTCNG